MRTALKVKVISRKKPVVKVRKEVTPAAVLKVVEQHPLIAMAIAEPNERRKRFLLALAHTLTSLSPDEMDIVEPTLCRRIGWNALMQSLKAIQPA